MSTGWAACAVWCLLTVAVQAHGLQLLFAKVTPTDHGTVQMEISADFVANPLIPDEASAREVIAKVLVGEQEGARVALGEMRFTRTTGLDPTCPLKFPPAPDGGEHELLTGSLEKRVGAENFKLGIPQGNPHDVVLWVMGPDGKMRADQHYYLIGGDPLVGIVMPPQRAQWKIPLLGGLAGIAGLIGWRWVRLRRASGGLPPNS